MFCEKCGNKLPNDAKFCNKCGKAVSGVVNNKKQDINNNLENSYKKTASWGKRLANFLIDRILSFIWLILYISVLWLVFYLLNSDILWSIGVLVGILMLPIYYLFFESIWQKTPAKFLTNTKVVMMDGSKPDFKHILGRTLCRFIPYEFLSFLSSNPTGWHDRLSGTLVVPDSYTIEDIKSIRTEKKSKLSIAITIVCIVLVVIAVIAVLSSIVLVNVTTYINKGKDAAIEGNLSTIMTNGSVYYDSNSSYTDFCTSDLMPSLETAINSAGGTLTKNCNANHFCACSNLKMTSGASYCVDDTGYKKETSTDCSDRCNSLQDTCSD